MFSLGLIFVYCLLIVAASLAGGWLPQLVRLTHLRMQMIISFVGGLMLGVSLLHMLPHAYGEMGDIARVARWCLIGVLVMFGMLRVFHFHEHSAAESEEGNGGGHQHGHHHGHHHDHADHAGEGHDQGGRADRNIGWTGVALGLALHTLLDGMALAASVLADEQHGSRLPLFGLGTFLAVVLHKPLDALSITALMAAGRWSSQWQQAVNAAFASMCPLGAALFFVGWRMIGPEQQAVLGSALAFSAGLFICISLSDLLPEVQFHVHHRLLLSTLLLLGVAAAYAIELIEPAHQHAPPSAPAPAAAISSPT